MDAREIWLEAATLRLRAQLDAEGFTSDVVTRASCGWPHKHGTARKKRRIGECWDPRSSAGGTAEIFISPIISNTLEVLVTLAHELCHAVVGLEHGHKGPFIKAVRAIGLTGKPSSGEAGDEFKGHAMHWISALGEYPHAVLNAAAVQKERDKEKQGTRMLKCECMVCGYTVRTTAKWLDAAGPPICPCNAMVMLGPEEKEENDDGDR